MFDVDDEECGGALESGFDNDVGVVLGAVHEAGEDFLLEELDGVRRNGRGKGGEEQLQELEEERLEQSFEALTRDLWQARARYRNYRPLL